MSTSTWEPSKPIALLPLINKVKKLGFSYRSSSSYYSSGASVSNAYYYPRGDEREIFNVEYYTGGVGYSSSREERETQSSDKLFKIAEALMASGLGVEPRVSGKGDISCLLVFAYDNTADLEAFRAQQVAEAREAAKVTPAEKAERVDEAAKKLLIQKLGAKQKAAFLGAQIGLLFEGIAADLSGDKTGEALKKAEALSELCKGSMSEVQKLFWEVNRADGAKNALTFCQNLELK